MTTKTINPTSKLSALLTEYRDAYAYLYYAQDQYNGSDVTNAEERYNAAEKELHDYLRLLAPQEFPNKPQLETNWGLEFLQPGDVEIWYAKTDNHAKYVGAGGVLSTDYPSSRAELVHSHTKLGSIKAQGVSFFKGETNSFSVMNTYIHFAHWQHSNAGRAAITSFCEALNVHVAMSVGDVIVHEDTMYVVVPTGLIKVDLNAKAPLLSDLRMSSKEYVAWNWVWPANNEAVDPKYKYSALNPDGTLVLSTDTMKISIDSTNLRWLSITSEPLLVTPIKVDMDFVSWKTTQQKRKPVFEMRETKNIPDKLDSYPVQGILIKESEVADLWNFKQIKMHRTRSSIVMYMPTFNNELWKTVSFVTKPGSTSLVNVYLFEDESGDDWVYDVVLGDTSDAGLHLYDSVEFEVCNVNNKDYLRVRVNDRLSSFSVEEIRKMVAAVGLALQTKCAGKGRTIITQFDPESRQHFDNISCVQTTSGRNNVKSTSGAFYHSDLTTDQFAKLKSYFDSPVRVSASFHTATQFAIEIIDDDVELNSLSRTDEARLVFRFKHNLKIREFTSHPSQRFLTKDEFAKIVAQVIHHVLTLDESKK